MPLLSPAGLPIHIDAGGEQHVLARLPPSPQQMRMRATMTAFPVIDRTKWVDVDRRSQFQSDYCMNQKSHGSCVGFSAAIATMKSRALRGQTFQALSGAYIYSWINGGGDNGAVITDALTELQAHGTCLDSTVSWDMIYRNQTSKGDAEAQRFKIAMGFTIDKVEQMASALQLGFIPQYAIQVGSNFESYDAEGVCGYERGGGNHSIHVDGMTYSAKSGRWLFHLQNSWGSGWGSLGNGRAYLSEQHFTGVQSQDAFTHMDELFDPNDPNIPPMPKG